MGEGGTGRGSGAEWLSREPGVGARGAERLVCTWQVSAGREPVCLALCPLPGALAGLELLFLWGTDCVGGPRLVRACPCHRAVWLSCESLQTYPRGRQQLVTPQAESWMNLLGGERGKGLRPVPVPCPHSIPHHYRHNVTL